MRDWEVDGVAVVKTATEAVDGFISDREAMKLSDAMMRKYRNVGAEMKALFGNRPLASITPDEIRAMRKNWKLAAITAQKRMEMVRKFFSFCVDGEWIEKSPARLVKMPPVKYDPTLPFTDQEMEKILWAADSIREAHPKIPAEMPKKLKALILLMRYSGSLAAGANCAIHGHFNPTATGPLRRLSPSLTTPKNSAQSIALSGTGQ